MAIERIDGRAVERHSDGAGTLALTIPRLFLGWGECRSRTGAATAAGGGEQVGGGMIIRVAHLEIPFGNGDRNTIALFMVTVTKNRVLGLFSIFLSQEREGEMIEMPPSGGW